MKKNEIVVAPIYKDDMWGWAISAYYPLYSKTGQCVGFLGCDFDVSELVDVKESLVGTFNTFDVLALTSETSDLIPSSVSTYTLIV